MEKPLIPIINLTMRRKTPGKEKGKKEREFFSNP
jgi:hypothetical protein